MTLIATYALYVRPAAERWTGRDERSPIGPRTTDDEDCGLVRQAEDQCAFVLANCQDDEAGLLPYLTFYYCTLGHVQPLAFIVLVVWLGTLFSTIGIAASDFFSVNLSTIASILGLSESLAGVTFLAFGNGSPDVFSTFAAMSSNSGSMAVGELIGAASFITAVVAGSMALVREFKVSKKSFVRDICFFIAAVSFAMVFLADGRINLWECITMVGFYVFYVIVVVGWHWLSTRRRRARAKEAASRGHFYGTVGTATDELEPYRDDVDADDEAAPVGNHRHSVTEDMSLLERGPRIDIEGVDDAGDDDEERGIHITAEMTSSMRVSRPRGRRSTTTITPIRPSLVGALEFRSVLASLQKSGNVHLAPINRRYTDHHLNPLVEASTASLGALDAGGLHVDTSEQAAASGRERALSSGAIPLNLENPELPPPTIVTEPPKDSFDGVLAGHLNAGEGPSVPTGNMAPPLRPISPKPEQPGDVQRAKSPVLQLQIPGTHPGSGQSSPSTASFPRYVESPLPMTAMQGPSRTSTFSLPTPALTNRTSFPFPGIEDQGSHKPVKWWPYKLLPPPHVLLGTLFPTLQNWSEKNIWDKFVSIVSVPSIFLLVTTLPVVDTDHDCDDSDDAATVNPPRPGSPGRTAPPVSIEHHASIEAETEWQRYRRTKRSATSRSNSHQSSPSFLALDARLDMADIDPHSLPPRELAQPAPGLQVETPTESTAESGSWNRWLVALQLFTGPLFTVFVIWANMEESPRMLVRLVLYSLLGSLILLAVLLLTTTQEKRPKYHFLLCFLGFVISIAWISTIAGEVVGVLKGFGVILGISEAILGLTVFAVGNSLGDLVADVTVARLGYPVMAL